MKRFTRWIQSRWRMSYVKTAVAVLRRRPVISNVGELHIREPQRLTDARIHGTRLHVNPREDVLVERCEFIGRRPPRGYAVVLVEEERERG